MSIPYNPTKIQFPKGVFEMKRIGATSIFNHYLDLESSSSNQSSGHTELR